MTGERTRSVHGDEAPHRGSLLTPIHQTSTFTLESADDVDDVYEGRRAGDVYTRHTNPTLSSVARRIAVLEQTETATLTASGMAALACTILANVPTGGRLIATQDLYGGTLKLLATMRDRYGVKVEYVPTREPDALRRALAAGPADLVLLETPTNPTHRIADLRESARICREHQVRSAVDSTFASPINTKPHELGIDLVIHSATKYLAGHSAVTAGVVCGTHEHVKPIEDAKRLFGPVLDPHAAFLLEQGMRTLPLRVEAANHNGLAMARHLADHADVKRVHYAGLDTHSQHALAASQMRGFGGVLSFDLANLAQAKAFLDKLRLIRNAASLGGVESLCSIPVQQSHRGQSESVLANSDITPGTIRLALGIEDTQDLIDDVDAAIQKSLV